MDARALDQFYTRRQVAARCAGKAADYVARRGGDWGWVEPAAGDGAFLDFLPPDRVALDIAPRGHGIDRADFLTWRPRDPATRLMFVGNPPFGKNASLARRFFDRAAMLGDAIAFILPRTFQKPAFIDRLDPHMHLVAEEVLDEESFVYQGEPYRVPTVFQIWERRTAPRARMRRELIHPDFSFVRSDSADFAFQRVGARAGLVSYEGLRKSPQSHYFIKSHITSDRLFRRLTSLDWNDVKWRTAGNPSIGKGELIEIYRREHG